MRVTKSSMRMLHQHLRLVNSLLALGKRNKTIWQIGLRSPTMKPRNTAMKDIAKRHSTDTCSWSLDRTSSFRGVMWVASTYLVGAIPNAKTVRRCHQFCCRGHLSVSLIVTSTDFSLSIGEQMCWNTRWKWMWSRSSLTDGIRRSRVWYLWIVLFSRRRIWLTTLYTMLRWLWSIGVHLPWTLSFHMAKPVLASHMIWLLG